ncbi:MAG: DUF1475 family protein [Thermoanaerobaculia bacterium]
MRKFLFILFFSICALMIAITVTASLERGMFVALADLWSDAWFRATLADAYFGFVTFYGWVAYREDGWIGRVSWLLAILALGNIAMSVYVVACLWALPADAPRWHLLLRPEHRRAPHPAAS